MAFDAVGRSLTRHCLRRGFLLAQAAFVACGVGCRPADTPPLSTAAVRARWESGGPPNDHSVVVPAHSSVRVLLDQRQTDLALSAVRIDGTERRTVDMRDHGIETLTLVAEQASTFVVTVSAVGDRVRFGEYDVRLESAAASVTATARRQQEAERLESSAKALMRDTRPESRRTAFDLLHAALTIWRETDDPLGRAATLARIGDIHLNRGEFEASHDVYVEALAIYRERYPHQAAVVRQNLAVALGRRGRLHESKPHFQQALAVFRSTSPLDAAATIASEGSLAFEAGDVQLALERFQTAEELFENRGDPRETVVLVNLAVAHRFLGDLEASQLYLTRALERLDRTDAATAQGRARIIVRLGQVALERGEVRIASAHATDALTIFARFGDRVGQADAHDLLGLAAKAGGRPDDALARYQQALTMYGNVPRGVATVLHHIAAVHADRGNRALAREFLVNAVATWRGAGLLDGAAESLYELGMLEWRARNLDAADRHFAETLAIVETVRGRVAGDASRAAYLAMRRKYFAGAIGVAMQRHALDPAGGHDVRAYAIAERERSRSLLDLVREAGLPSAHVVDTGLVADVVEIRRELDFWSYQLAQPRLAADAPQAREVKDKVARLIVDYREAVARVQASDPRSAAVVSAPVLTARDVQQLLEPGTILLRFFLSEPSSYGWVVDHRGVRAVPLPRREEIDQQARLVADIVRRPRTRETAGVLAAQARVEMKRLSTMVLEPIAPFLDGAARLLIVADGAMQFVPIHALPAPGSGAPLLVQHEVVMLPSASLLKVLRSRSPARPAAARRLAVIADPVYERQDGRFNGRFPSADAPLLPVGRLGLSKLEAEAILRLVPEPQRLEASGFEATREAAIEQLRSASIWHVAAHAIALDPSKPELDSIVLSLYDRDGEPRDGLLRAYDIEPGIAARVVVLAACRTALGRETPGEGMMGLARSFISAGASTVIASLYPVEEPSTLELMELLYARLLGEKAMTPAAALRAAQLAVLAMPGFEDPYYWSAWVAIGEFRE